MAQPSATLLLWYAALLIPFEIAGLYYFRYYGVRTGTAWRGAVSLCIALGGLALLLAMALADRPGAARLLCSFLFVHLPLVMLAAAAICAAYRHYAPAAAGAFVAVALAAVGVDAFLLEPTWLVVSYETIQTSKLDNPLRIVVVADFQADAIGPYERRVIETAAAEKPDLLLFLGDYLQSPVKPKEELHMAFREIWNGAGPKPPFGTFAVRGNCDRADWAALFDGLDVRTVSRTESVDVGPIRLTCLGMEDSFDHEIVLQRPDDDSRFHVVAGHCANFMLGDIPGDLMLAGHSHGGQLQIPFFGPPLTLSVAPRRWCAGILSRREDGAWVRVSRGTGMERGNAPRLRFWCRPEIVVIDLVPRASAP